MSIQNISFSKYMKLKITLNYSKSAGMGFFQGTQERVRNSHGRATEVLLYAETMKKYGFLWP